MKNREKVYMGTIDPTRLKKQGTPRIWVRETGKRNRLTFLDYIIM